MRIVRGLPPSPSDLAPSAVALGVFDGVHLGHRAILGRALALARGAGGTAIVCTFDPHPMEVLRPAQAPIPITTLEERLALIGDIGIDAAVVLPFDRPLAAFEPEEFVREVLVGRLGARDVVVGFNHRFGRGARGDAALLDALSGRLGFHAHVIPPLDIDGTPVSSSAIRASLGAGDVEGAARHLGRPYSVMGTVERGEGRGRTLGFPTANLAVDRPLLVPGGVYACEVAVGGTRHPAVVNIGVRPTFGSGGLAVEAHLLDFGGDLYGRSLRLSFVARLREERRFPGADALRAQIGHDVAQARERLAGVSFTSSEPRDNVSRN